jgi:hypothetical protein
LKLTSASTRGPAKPLDLVDRGLNHIGMVGVDQPVEQRTVIPRCNAHGGA